MESYATAQQVYVAGLVFARVASMIMLMPGLGEASVSPRIRLSFALVTAICVAPIAAPHLPPLSATVGGLTGHVLKEVIIGLMLGAILRLFMSSLATAGEIISIQTTLAFAQTANPMQAQPGSTIAAFLALLGVTLLFATDTNTGRLTPMKIKYFYNSVHASLIGNYDAPCAAHVVVEVFDLLACNDPQGATLDDMLTSKQGHVVVTMLLDVNGFWRYDNRESLVGGDDDDTDIPARRDKRVESKAKGLVKKVEKLLPELTLRPAFSWGGTFAETEDGLPFFGEHPQWGPRVLFAMAYGGNGISYSMIGAGLLRATIEGRSHPLAPLFGFSRLD